VKLFNNYADQAGYYDLCLLIYHAADYRQPATIAGTWANLIQQAHDEVVARMQAGAKAVPGTPLPYESVSVKIQEIAHRTSCDTIIFPVNVLLPEVCQYAVANQQDAHIGADPAWPVQLFLSVGISHDLITRILENVYDTQDYGFAGVARTRLIELIMFVVDAWVKDVRRRGAGPSRGSNMIGAGVRELLERCEADLPAPGHGQNTGGADLNEVRRQLRQVRRDMDSLAERMATGSVRFA
jgi:nuclear pore complex protein Nup155